MTRTSFWACAGFAFLGLCARSWAAAGTVSAEFLTENPSARQVGMGGLTAVASEGSDALHSNPAGLAQTLRPETNFSYTAGRDQASHMFAAYAHPLQAGPSLRLGFGAGILYYTAGNIDINPTGGPTQSFNAEKDYSGILGLSAGVPGRVSIGVTPKFVRSTLVERYTATTFAADIGLQFSPLPGTLRRRLDLGFTVRNLGSQISYKSVQNDLPRTTAFGALGRLVDSRQYGALSAGVQMEKILDDTWKWIVGGEYAIGDPESPRSFFLRGGYRPQSSGGDFSIGVGAREKNVQLDYAFVNGADLENTHRVSLTFRFGAYVEPDQQDELREEMKSDHDAMPQPEKEKFLSPSEGRPEEFRTPAAREKGTGDYKLIPPNEKGTEEPKLMKEMEKEESR